MDTRRVVLYAALAFIVYSLWMSWHIDFPPAKNTNPELTQSDSLLPNMEKANEQPQSDAVADQPHSTSLPLIQVTTDVFKIAIDSRHGDIINAQLLNYPVSVEEPNKPITILTNQPSKRYVANSSLFTNNAGKVQNIDFNFSATEPKYTLMHGENELRVVLEGNADGLNVKKVFTFTRGSYLIKVDYVINNETAQVWQGYMNTQLLRINPESEESGMFQVGSYTGASYSNPGQSKYKKVSFKDMAKADLNVDTKGGWIAMQQHYFLSSWVPTFNANNIIYTRSQNGSNTIGSVSPSIKVAPGATKQLGAQLYVGPEVTHVLEGIAPGLDMTVDYGWLWFLSSILFTIMKAIHAWVGNWGWSIVLVTILVKLAFYRLSATSYKSMAGMRKLQPKLQALRERYGDDKAKMSQATMELYRQEKVNPLGGCLPILIQIPVFIALYWVLIESVELRQAPFIFWIKDLASADPYHVLPVIMGITMLIQQRLNPAPPDPMQAKIMMFLPVLFTVLFWNFPAGLVLYWIVNNSLSILQQWYITRKYSDTKPVSKKLAAVK